ncbi:MAG TPA: DUF3788 domain-containing protein [Candidatus Udaeobacter sp.]|nr:DUF3788 domain-containing protein [Candidatus Udaeobacter sp.]
MALRATSRAKKQSSVISQNAFAGQAQQPTQKAVEEALGQSYALWKKIISDLKNELKLDGEEWNSSGHKYGWSLRLQLKKRNIVYLGPRTGSFMAAFVLGDKAVAVARKSELPAYVLDMIAEAKRYAEGTPVRIEVSKPKHVELVKILAKIKVEN